VITFLCMCFYILFYDGKELCECDMMMTDVNSRVPLQIVMTDCDLSALFSECFCYNLSVLLRLLN